MTKQELTYVAMLEEALRQPQLLTAYRGDLLRHNKNRVLDGREDAVYTWTLRTSGTELVEGRRPNHYQGDEVHNVYVVDVHEGTVECVHMECTREKVGGVC